MPSIDHWRATWKGLRAPADDHLYGELIARYSEPSRRYHTLQHLDECFVRLGEVRHAVERLPEVELALWFHDAIYDVRKDDNEEQSAAWAGDAVRRAGVGDHVAGRIQGLVMATKHDALPDTPDAGVVIDVDLSILGASVERFDEYERQVREEYAWVPGWLFRRKRREILKRFLARPQIYSTEYFIRTFEATARANLERSVISLGG
jgi:predicted metal-dependent HD superfamily phosphohydrolase